jgi:hypothetical protein
LTLAPIAFIFLANIESELERPFMKNIQLLAVLALVLALGGVARADAYVKPAAITVVGIHGEARYSTDGTTWHPLVVGKILHAGAVIETADASTCDLVLSGTPVAIPEVTSDPASWAGISAAPDPNVRGYIAYKPMAQQNVIRMQSGTMLAVDKLTVIDTGVDTVGDTELDLRAGKIFTSVKKLSASSQYIIKLPNGVAGIRGASGVLGADDSVECVTGTIVLSVIVNGGPPQVITLNGGFQYDPQTGQVVSISPEMLIQFIQQFTAIISQYQQIKTLSIDVTEVYISPTQGKLPGGGNGNNNNNNNDDDDDGDGLVLSGP